MKVSTVANKMLYCPKCQQTYEDGVQRFCLNDGGRLLPAASSGKSADRSGGVFSSVVNRKTGEETDEFATAPRFSQIAFRPPASKIFKPEPDLIDAPPVEKLDSEVAPELAAPSPTFDYEPELELGAPSEPRTSRESSDDIELELELEPLRDATAAPAETLLELDAETPAGEETEAAVEDALPLTEPPHSVGADDVPNSQELLDDREIGAADGAAIGWENPEVWLGRAIKERYRIAERIGADDGALQYLAEDETVAGEKVVVRILMDDETLDSFADEAFAEEKDSLRRISHPNVIGIIDSGELPEGKRFVVTEYVKGESVKSRLDRKGSFDAVRTARLVRQTAYALSEIHRSGVPHRHLKPENIVLTVNENGAEQVKLKDFGASEEKLNEKNLPYKSPEQVEGKLANFASDEFALAVIAYQMLTNRLPFNATTIGGLLKEQREGLIVRATTLHDNLPPPVDEVLAKALAFNAADRYPKARDFGDALFNAVTAKPNPTEPDEFQTEEAAISAASAPLAAKSSQKIVLSPLVETKSEAAAPVDESPGSVKATEDLAWEKRSSELPVKNNGSRTALGLLGLAILLAGLLGIWFFFVNKQNAPVQPAPAPVPGVESPNRAGDSAPSVNLNAPIAAPPLGEIESAPPPRTVVPPPNSIYFQNSREKLSSEAAKNFLGFSLYYPQGWQLKEAKNNFLDVSKTDEKGLPIEQMLVSFYDSRGTFKADREDFPKLLEKSNNDLKKALQGNYKIISQGETKIQNGRWQAFEVAFESLGTAANGERVTLWGRRLWIPTQLNGTKNGYVVTMLATSLSNDVKSVADVGVKGELSNILETFEPNF